MMRKRLSAGLYRERGSHLIYLGKEAFGRIIQKKSLLVGLHGERGYHSLCLRKEIFSRFTHL